MKIKVTDFEMKTKKGNLVNNAGNKIILVLNSKIKDNTLKNRNITFTLLRKNQEKRFPYNRKRIIIFTHKLTKNHKNTHRCIYIEQPKKYNANAKH